ncbi:hypothetical protein Rhal01_02508 [Rubritalea halochordaticola]|uniref:Uncharacterized protein n=1 Tax=Rubritalea halochordaticola TaxID=714537 RepID=A0ABP9V2W8_9BACT
MLDSRHKRAWLAAGVCLALLAGLSYLSTSAFWDGSYPAGIYEVRLIDSDGKPIQNQPVRLINSYDDSISYGYPVHNFSMDTPLITDEHGIVTLIRPESGLEFGGERWKLFWIFEFGSKGPNFLIEVNTDHGPATANFRDIFETPSLAEVQSRTLKFDDEQQTLPVLNNTVLCRSK